MDRLASTTCKTTTKRKPDLQFYTRILNLIDITFTKEETRILELGFQHNFDKAPQIWIQDQIIDMETAFNCLDKQVQKTTGT
jgi:hypothetical protein